MKDDKSGTNSEPKLKKTKNRSLSKFYKHDSFLI